MKIKLNGKDKELAGPIMVSQLIEELNLNTQKVVVEINEEVIERDSFSTQEVKAEDTVEILRFVGGG